MSPEQRISITAIVITVAILWLIARSQKGND